MSFVTVHSVHSNLVKMHSKSPSVIAFCPVCLGILPYSWQNTSRDITCEQLPIFFLQKQYNSENCIFVFTDVSSIYETNKKCQSIATFAETCNNYFVFTHTLIK